MRRFLIFNGMNISTSSTFTLLRLKIARIEHVFTVNNFDIFLNLTFSLRKKSWDDIEKFF